MRCQARKMGPNIQNQLPVGQKRPPPLICNIGKVKCNYNALSTKMKFKNGPIQSTAKLMKDPISWYHQFIILIYGKQFEGYLPLRTIEHCHISWYHHHHVWQGSHTPHICHNHRNRWLCKSFESSVKFSQGTWKKVLWVSSFIECAISHMV